VIFWVVGFAAIGSVGAILGSVAVLAFPEQVRRTILPFLLSYATGTLLGAAFLGMIPNAVALAPASTVCAAVLGGIVLFFVLETLLLWRHSHDPDFAARGAAGPLILVGDSFHNLADGLVIASGFLVSIPLGIAVSLAVVAHEVPQEVGDFAILLDHGYRPWRAFAYNLLSATATLPGAIAGYFWLETSREALPYVLAFSAASFLYIAIADLVPRLHRGVGFGRHLCQFALLLAGIGTISLFRIAQ
jgi:zinc and cadmium transporter